MPETDYSITKRITDVKEQKTLFWDAFDKCSEFVNDRSRFLRGKGTDFFTLLAQLRKTSVQPGKRGTPLSSMETNVERESEPKKEPRSLTIPPAIIACAAIIGLSFLGIYGYLLPGAVVLAIFGVLGLVFLPAIVYFFLTVRAQKATQEPELGTLFDTMIEDYKQAILVVRVVLESGQHSQPKRLDYYRILELPHGAGENEIKGQFRKMVLEYHPDTNKSKHSEEKFKQIIEAHEILSDPVRRFQYDKGRDPDDTPYNDELATDVFAQTQLFLSAKFNRMLGTIVNISERELDRMERIALQQAADISCASSIQPMKSTPR